VMYAALGCMAVSTILSLFVSNQKIPMMPKVAEKATITSHPQSPQLRQLTLPAMLDGGKDKPVIFKSQSHMNPSSQRRKRNRPVSQLPSLPLIAPLSPLFDGKRHQNHNEKSMPSTPSDPPSPILSYEIPKHISSRLRRNRNSWVMN
jgi:hypothetical protein